MVGPGERHELADTFAISGAGVDEHVVATNRARQDFQVRDRAEELIDSGLEHVGEDLAVGIDGYLDRLASGLDRGGFEIGGGGTDVADELEQMVDADGARGRPAQHGEDGSVVDGIVKQTLELFGRRHLALEILLEDGIVALDHLLDQRLVAYPFRLYERGGYIDLLGLTRVVHERMVGEQVGDAVEARALADRQLDRFGVRTEGVAEAGHRRLEGGVGPVESIDEYQTRSARVRCVAPEQAIVGLYARDGVDHEDHELRGLHRLKRVADEIRMAWRVDDGDRMAVPVERHGDEGEAVVELVLFGLDVAHGRAVFDAPWPSEHAGAVQHRLDEARLASAVATDERHVPDRLSRHPVSFCLVERRRHYADYGSRACRYTDACPDRAVAPACGHAGATFTCLPRGASSAERRRTALTERHRQTATDSPPTPDRCSPARSTPTSGLRPARSTRSSCRGAEELRKPWLIPSDGSRRSESALVCVALPLVTRWRLLRARARPGPARRRRVAARPGEWRRRSRSGRSPAGSHRAPWHERTRRGPAPRQPPARCRDPRRRRCSSVATSSPVTGSRMVNPL